MSLQILGITHTENKSLLVTFNINLENQSLCKYGYSKEEIFLISKCDLVTIFESLLIKFFGLNINDEINKQLIDAIRKVEINKLTQIRYDFNNLHRIRSFPPKQIDYNFMVFTNLFN